MLEKLREEVLGLERARGERQAMRLVAQCLTGELATAGLDEALSQRLFESASRNGVLGLFPLSHPQLRQSLLAQQARAMRALKFTHRVVAAIEDAKIPVVVLKGVVAASRWTDPTLRQQSDVDVLVEAARKDEAAAALIAAGVCGGRFLDAKHMHNDSLTPKETSGLLVEVHQYFNAHHENRADISEILARRVRVKTALGSLPAMAAEDEAVYLALHATTHALQRLAWLVDLWRLDASWVEAARRAKAWRVAEAVAPAWMRTRALLGASIPIAAFDELGVPVPHRRLAELILGLADRSEGDTHVFFERAFRLAVVPPGSLPRVLRQKMAARREERLAYERARAAR